MTSTVGSSVAGARAAEIEVALVGRPNAGKTSLLVQLTGAAQRPVNFAGSSVERAEGRFSVGTTRIRLVDLPGISALASVSPDEEVTLDYLRQSPGPDVICVVIDATKLRLELALLRDLVGLGKPIVVALNKADSARQQGAPINAAALAEMLQMAVIETDGRRGRGLQWLGQAIVAAGARGPAPSIVDSVDSIAARAQSAPALIRTWTDRLDALFLHPWLGLPVLLLVMFAAFQLVFTVADPFVGWIEDGQQAFGEFIGRWLPAGTWRSFVVDGLVNGVGSILVFLPQIVLLIAFVTVLEGSGYMARAAFLLDRAMGRVGLTGRSFLPLTTSFACAIPGILASRVIANERDRIATIVVAPLMSCSARLPVYVVMIGAFFPLAWAGIVLFALYALGVVAAAVVAVVVRRTVLRGGASPLLMELPSYQLPSLRVVWSQVRSASRAFAVLAGTVILITSIVIWAASYFPRPDSIRTQFEAARTAVAADAPDRMERLVEIDQAERTAYLEQSWLARAGKSVQPVFAPAGFDWRTTVGVLAAFPARELIVPTMGILYSAGDVDPGDYDLSELEHADDRPGGLRSRLRSATRADGTRAFDASVALAVMVFFALCSQCMATLGTIRRETRSWRWPAFTFAYMTAIAWLGAVATHQLGTLAGLGGVG